MNNLLLNFPTPLNYKSSLSMKYKSNIFYKREDISIYNSYKSRIINFLKKKKSKLVIVCYPIHLKPIYKIITDLNLTCMIYTLKKPIIKNNDFNNKKINIEYFGLNINKLIDIAKKKGEEKGYKYIDFFDDNIITSCYGKICEEIIDQLGKINLDVIILSGSNPDLIYGISKFCDKYMKGVKIIVSGINKKKIFDTYYYNFFLDKEYKNKNIVIHQTKESVLIEFILNTYINESNILELTSGLTGCILNRIDIYGKNVVCIINDSKNEFDFIQDMLIKYVNKN